MKSSPVICPVIFYGSYFMVVNRFDMGSVAEESNYGTSVNFNQDSKVIVKHKESPDTHNNSTKSSINELLTTNVPLKTRNKPERLFTVNVISSGDHSRICLLRVSGFVSSGISGYKPE